MEIISYPTNLTFKARKIAIGGFDGMHYAHQEVIKNVDVIFCIGIEYSNITPFSLRNRHSKLPIIGIKLIDIKALSAKEFVEFILKIFPSLDTIFVGYDFRFAKDRAGNIKTLKKLSGKNIKTISEIKLDNVSIHSQVIRDLISQGDIKLANRYLGFNYLILGKQIKGQGLGSKSIFPTININAINFHIPKFGVYETNTNINNNKYKSISFIGNRCSTDNEFAIETHIINEDVSNQDTLDIEIEFIDFIRDNIIFDDLKDLKLQISKDISDILHY
jgi:riboflavin kinase/FMN adenylyltransferase